MSKKADLIKKRLWEKADKIILMLRILNCEMRTIFNFDLGMGAFMKIFNACMLL